MSEYMLKRRAMMMAGKPVEVKPVKSIPKRSKKMEEEMKLYRPEMMKYLKANPVCKLDMQGCAKVATCVHHTRGREGEQLHNQKDWLPSCVNCNLQVEIKDLEARQKGVKKSKHKIS